MADSGILGTIAANPLIVASVGGVAFAAAGFVLRSLPKAVGAFTVGSLTTRITVTSRYSTYNDVVAHLGRHVLPWTNRSLAAAENGTALTTGYGSGMARYGSTLISYKRSIDGGQNTHQRETVTLRFLTRDQSVAHRFVEDAIRSDRDGMVHIRVMERGGSWTNERSIVKPKRSLASVYASAEVKDRLVSGVRSFLQGEANYRARGIPYRFCAVLHGSPGTGKTSLIHALASEFDFSIVYATSLDGIAETVGRCGPNDILVLEDLDALAEGLNRTDMGGKPPALIMEGISPLHALLNTLDGFCTPHGLKVAITTNHVDRLDDAILRPGRADLLIEVGPLDDEAIRDMFAAFYGEGASAMLDRRPLPPVTGARLQQILTTHSAQSAADMLKATRLEVVHG